jgi:hypothetical protein
MFGFRPGRNSRHPGDRPPMWAPLSRAGRLTLAIAVIAGVVIALMILATRPVEASRDAVAAGACVQLSDSASAGAAVPDGHPHRDNRRPRFGICDAATSGTALRAAGCTARRCYHRLCLIT